MFKQIKLITNQIIKKFNNAANTQGCPEREGVPFEF